MNYIKLQCHLICNYTRIIVGTGFLYGAFVMNVIWVFSDIHQVEPKFCLLVFLGAVFLGGHYREKNFYRSTLNIPTVEEFEELEIRPWKRINHGVIQQGWGELSSRENYLQVKSIIRKEKCILFGLMMIGYPIIIEELTEPTQTKNFRVMPFFLRPWFFKIFNSSNPRRIVHNNLDVVDVLKTSGTFDQKYLRSLTPIRLRTAHNEKDHFWAPIDKSPSYNEASVTFQIFPLLYSLPCHFSGAESELKSVAEKLGAVQEQINKNISDHSNKINSLRKRDIHHNKDEIERRWEVLKGDLYSNQNLPFTIKKQDFVLVDDTVQLIGEYLGNSEEGTEIFVHDMHPHNVLFQKNEGECKLIYDFDWLGDWRHSEVLALSLHRFVRQYLINETQKIADADLREMPLSKDEIEQQEQNLIKSGCQIFLNGYFSTNTKKDKIPSAFWDNPSTFIKAANLLKLLSAGSKMIHGISETQYGHTKRRQAAEFSKFWSFLIEANAFSNALHDLNQVKHD